jgi:hypothetical protein
LVLAVLLAVSAISYAYQPDASYLQLAEKNKAKWAAEDKQIDAKLAALEKRFGKKPNIIYILADDVGWGELGWQGGGKHRGTPTPELDKMAYEGMRFWSAYAEPSCTPSRSGEYTFSAQVTGVALTAGAAAKADYRGGVVVFVVSGTGLMVDASLGGQKFSYVPKSLVR